jgi:ABC-type nitrate/sulfonate/bicarbonate transport system substrate-binding protein
MPHLSRRHLLQAAAIAALASGHATPAPAQDRPKIRVGSLTIPVFSPILVNVVKARQFDAKHGFELEPRLYPSIAAYYAGFATGEVDTLLGGPTNFQKLATEGVGLKVIATAAKLSDLVILTKDESIKSLADLKGKQLAADMGSGQYQILSIYALAKGLELGKQITIVPASFAVARAQLAADRVEAAMVIEPIATMMLKENPNLKIIFNANDAWKEITGKEGWELVYGMREDSLKRDPMMAQRFIAALQDAAAFMRNDPDGADKIAVDTVKLPPGVLKEAVMTKRWDVDVQPAWLDQKQVIWDMFERAVTAGFHPKLPDASIIYAP